MWDADKVMLNQHVQYVCVFSRAVREWLRQNGLRHGGCHGIISALLHLRLYLCPSVVYGEHTPIRAIAAVQHSSCKGNYSLQYTPNSSRTIVSPILQRYYACLFLAAVDSSVLFTQFGMVLMRVSVPCLSRPAHHCRTPSPLRWASTSTSPVWQRLLSVK